MNMQIKWIIALAMTGWIAACGPDTAENQRGHSHDAASNQEESWAVTSWGDQYEIFAEADPLVAGKVVKSHTHVTVLDRFQALTEGKVSAVLRSPDGTETVFMRPQPLRPGIYSIVVVPQVEGEFELIFRVETPNGIEAIPSGRVRVGNTTQPGGLIEAPAYWSDAAPSGSPPVGFLKEQQWKTAFATEWVTTGTVREMVDGPARIRAAVGGDVIVSAPVNGIVSTDLNVYTGADVQSGQPLVRLQPRAAAEQSISELRSDLSLARIDLERLETLFRAGAVTQAEIDAARSRVAGLEPLVESSAASAGLTVTSPLSGSVAEVWVRPGQSVSAGDSLLRVVKTSPLWIEVALDPAEADALSAGVHGFHIRIPGSGSRLSFGAEESRLIALSPSVDAETGTVTALLEIRKADERLRLGAVVEVEIASTKTRDGVVIPQSSLVDDGGTSVVYVQIEGESFERREVHVVARDGDSILIEGLTPGLRLVTVGGAMIRRSTLLSSGGIEGHVH